MKIKIFICSLLTIAVSFISLVPAFGQQASASARILIIIRPRAEEVKNEAEKEETTELKKQQVLAKEDSDSSEEKE